MIETKSCCICKAIKPLTEFHRHAKRKDGRQSQCKTCQKTYDKSYYQADPKRHQMLVKRWKSSVKAKINAIKEASGCVCCDEDVACCLDFHHLEDKSFTISRAYQAKAWRSVLKEIEKCVVLCANCHRKLHHGLFSLLRPRGEMVSHPAFTR